MTTVPGRVRIDDLLREITSLREISSPRLDGTAWHSVRSRRWLSWPRKAWRRSVLPAHLVTPRTRPPRGGVYVREVAFSTAAMVLFRLRPGLPGSTRRTTLLVQKVSSTDGSAADLTPEGAPARFDGRTVLRHAAMDFFLAALSPEFGWGLAVELVGDAEDLLLDAQWNEVSVRG
jgi:hypothetical protein